MLWARMRKASNTGRESERGFVLALAMVALLFGALLVIPFLDFARLRFGDIADSSTFEERYFAADAGIEAVMADLRRGEDALSPSYTLPSVDVNGYVPVITVSTPARDGAVPFGAVFVDPESGSSLAPLAGNSDFEYVIDNVSTFADFQVSWIFTPPDNGWQLTVFEGVGTGGSQLANATKNASPARLTLDPGVIIGGSYTIRFRSKSPTALTSAPFSAVGEPGKTWVRVNAYKDYEVTSTVGDITLTAFARQGPGPNQIESSLHQTTWNGFN
ncbi:MAG: hypothetical protein V3S98_00575 [Dehalococcoidia bacterium]